MLLGGAGDNQEDAVLFLAEADHVRHLVDEPEDMAAGGEPGLFAPQVYGGVLGAEVGLQVVRSAGPAVDGSLKDAQEGRLRQPGGKHGRHRQGAVEAVVAVALGISAWMISVALTQCFRPSSSVTPMDWISRGLFFFWTLFYLQLAM